jgi:hypothetical protein
VLKTCAATTDTANSNANAISPWEETTAARSVLKAATNTNSCRNRNRNSGNSAATGAGSGRGGPTCDVTSTDVAVIFESSAMRAHYWHVWWNRQADS